MPAIRKTTAQHPLSTSLPVDPFDVGAAFPGRTYANVQEVAKYLAATDKHILLLLETGELNGVDLSSKGAVRKSWRVPIPELQAFVNRRRGV